MICSILQTLAKGEGGGWKFHAWIPRIITAERKHHLAVGIGQSHANFCAADYKRQYVDVKDNDVPASGSGNSTGGPFHKRQCCTK